MSDAQHTPGPWYCVPGNEYHGPYVESDYGSTICDCYAMSNPNALSVRNGGDSKPIWHLAEMADPNARLIAAAPELLDALKCFVADERFIVSVGGNPIVVEKMIDAARAVIAKAEGKAPQ